MAAAKKRATPIEPPVFHDALASFWKEAYQTPHGMLSAEVLPPLAARPAFGAALKDAKHAVAGALRSVGTSPLSKQLSGWLAALRAEPPETRAFDGPAVAALLIARYAGAGWLGSATQAKALFDKLNEEQRAKVWAAIDCMQLKIGERPTPLQASVDALLAGGDATPLADAVYDAIANDEQAPAAVAKNITDCVQEIVDMAEQLVPPAPSPAAAPAPAAKSKAKARSAAAAQDEEVRARHARAMPLPASTRARRRRTC